MGALPGGVPGSGLAPWVAKPLGAIPVLLRHGMIEAQGSQTQQKQGQGGIKLGGASNNNNNSSRNYINNRIKNDSRNKNNSKNQNMNNNNYWNKNNN
jgi:hypothetical protein